MNNRHVTHMLARHAAGQLRPGQEARVINHVRVCADCREALIREERIAADLRREMPRFGQPHGAQMAQVWAGVWAEVGPAPRASRGRPLWLPGVSAVLAMLVIAVAALPLILERGMTVEAALVGPSPNVVVVTGSPVPDVTEDVSQDAPALAAGYALEPSATVALVSVETFGRNATPAPVPQSTASPLPVMN